MREGVNSQLAVTGRQHHHLQIGNHRIPHVMTDIAEMMTVIAATMIVVDVLMTVIAELPTRILGLMTVTVQKASNVDASAKHNLHLNQMGAILVIVAVQ